MPTYRLLIEYDGTRFHGWQRQPNARTVQQTMLLALSELAPRCVLGGSGRTDAGVHALGQVAHLVTRQTIDAVQLLDRLNSRLPRDVHVMSIVVADPRFDARRDALERYYLYQVALRRSAFHKEYIWWVKDRIDVGRVEKRMAELTGLHDFAAFADKRRAEDDSARVLLHHGELLREGDLLLFRFGGSHFIWKMVRRLVGVLVAVGTGRLPDEPIAALTAAHAHEFASLTAPASGLFLEYVRYRGDPAPQRLRSVTPMTSPRFNT
ncbi:MAG: tRNA pseudouridine(38-40) synthase TruA [Acidobacteriota bacterium]